MLPTSELDDYRQSIDYLDTSLMFLLAERCHTIAKLAAIKKQEHIKPEYSEERKVDIEKIMQLAHDRNLNRDFLQQLFQCILEYALTYIEQLTPEQAQQKITEEDLSALRNSLYNLDSAICLILAERFQTALKVAHYKIKHSLPLLDAQRWQALLEVKVTMAGKLGIKRTLVEDIFNAIHKESLRLQGIENTIR